MNWNEPVWNFLFLSHPFLEIDDWHTFCYQISVLAYFEPLGQQRDAPHWASLGFQACYLSLSAGLMRISHLRIYCSLIILLQKCSKWRKCLISIAITVLTNFEPLGLQKDAPHRGSMSILAFNLLQITGLMGLGLLTIFHFHYPPFQKWLKIRKILNFRHNRCSVKLQFWSSLSPNRTKEMHLIGHLWASQPSPCHRLLE